MLVLALLPGLSLPASAAVLSVDALPDGPVGHDAQVLQDAPGDMPDLARVRHRLAAGEGRAVAQDVYADGIGAPPTWLVWAVDNPGAARRLRFTLATAWIDRVDLYLATGDRLLGQWHAGDARPQRARPVAGPDFAFDVHLPPGRSTLYLRSDTADPLLLPVYLEPVETSLRRAWQSDLLQAFVAGYLLALIGYNLLIWIGVNKFSHLLYAGYLGTFLLLSLAYTGHGYEWLWPGHPGVQRYVILVLMVIYALAGLAFALRFLDLSRCAPRVHRAVRHAGLAVACGMLACVVGDRQALAAWLAFLTVGFYTVVMLSLGLVALRARQPAARYFLAASGAGMAGALTTSMAVLGVIGFSPWTFHAVELGMLADATLLALALAQQVRQSETRRVLAETQARIDPLTGLLNRRAFYERADKVWHAALHDQQALAAVMLDVDHFKRVNDTQGHAAGDRVLAEVGRVLARAARQGDIVVRWGGEEFLLLLPETGMPQACALAERLRLELSRLHLPGRDGRMLRFSASFGVGERGGCSSLYDLIDLADSRLLQAKEEGRDRVVAGTPPPDTGRRVGAVEGSGVPLRAGA